jgi:amicyanin
MKKSLIIVIVLLVLGAGGAYALTQRNKNTATNTAPSPQTNTDSSQSSSNQTTRADDNLASTSQTNEVEIEDFAFQPSTITVKKGTTVKWTNKDTAQHNVVSDQESGPNGPLLSKGQAYSFTFNKAGTYHYICELHPNMKGTVIVTD